ncbi:MAG: methyltransferase domain-containing protein [Nitrososphaerales archaeon]|nr:methyltransferase domain-containing protein [Nitrososphaerales archaeon]
MRSLTYLTSDDSALLRGAMRGRSGDASLEIGAGNGGGMAELALGFGLVVGTDLALPEQAREGIARTNLVIADVASCFRERVFDLVAFNPPYIPTETVEDPTVDGGASGTEVPLRFLREALRVVKRGGSVLMLLSSENPSDVFEEECGRSGFKMTKIAGKRLFYETLSVYEISSKT